MKVKLLTSFAGEIGDADSPAVGQEIQVSDELGRAMIEDGRAEATKGGGKRSSESAPEAAVSQPPEDATTAPPEAAVVEPPEDATAGPVARRKRRPRRKRPE